MLPIISKRLRADARRNQRLLWCPSGLIPTALAPIRLDGQGDKAKTGAWGMADGVTVSRAGEMSHNVGQTSRCFRSYLTEIQFHMPMINALLST